MEGKKHSHGGRSSQGTFDPLLVFNEIGLKKGERLMDAGCGTGYMSMIASRIIGPSGSVITLDADEWSLDILLKRVEFGSLKNILPKVHDITQPLDIDVSPYDHILFTNVMHGVILNSETVPVMEFISKHLNEKGQVCVIDFKKEVSGRGPPMDHRIDREEMITTFQEHGYKLKRENEPSTSHYLLIFGRDPDRV